MGIGDIWNILILNPMLNSLLFLYSLLFNNFTLTILVFTVLIRMITYPLTYQQQKATRKLTELQGSDAWKKMQEKYAKDREKLAQEQMKLYQEAGVNPFGSCLPTLIQFPVLIGLYQAINLAMATSPYQLLDLSTHIYSFLPNAAHLVPLQNTFLWLNLGLPDPFYLLPLIVVVTTWLQSRVMMPPTTGDAQAAQMLDVAAVPVGAFDLLGDQQRGERGAICLSLAGGLEAGPRRAHHVRGISAGTQVGQACGPAQEQDGGQGQAKGVNARNRNGRRALDY